MRILASVLAATIIASTPALAEDVDTSESARQRVSASRDCKGLRDLGLETEACWLLLKAKSKLSNEERARKRGLSQFYDHVKDHHDTKLGCEPPLGGLDSPRPRPGETETPKG